MKLFVISLIAGIIGALTYAVLDNKFSAEKEFIMATMQTCEDKRIIVFGDKETILSKINDGKLKFNGHYFPIKSYTYEGGDAFMIDERCYAERL